MYYIIGVIRIHVGFVFLLFEKGYKLKSVMIAKTIEIRQQAIYGSLLFAGNVDKNSPIGILD